MATCRDCGAEIEWAWHGNSYKPLEPAHNPANLPLRYEDENGVLRADHRDRHAIQLTRIFPARLPADAGR